MPAGFANFAVTMGPSAKPPPPPYVVTFPRGVAERMKLEPVSVIKKFPAAVIASLDGAPKRTCVPVPSSGVPNSGRPASVMTTAVDRFMDLNACATLSTKYSVISRLSIASPMGLSREADWPTFVGKRCSDEFPATVVTVHWGSPLGPAERPAEGHAPGHAQAVGGALPPAQ